MRIRSVILAIAFTGCSLASCGSNDETIQAHEFCNDYNSCGLMDLNGKVIVEPIFDDITSISFEPYWIASENELKGVIDKSGNWVLPPENEYIEYVFADRIVAEREGRRVLIDFSGREIIPFQYDQLEPLAKNMFMVKINGMTGLIDQNGRWIMPPEYQDFSYNLKSEVITFNKDGKWGFAGKDGTVFINAEYDSTKGFSEYGLAPVKQNDLWGYISLSNDLILEPRFFDAQHFTVSGYAAVETDKGWIFIKRDGQPAFDKIFDYAKTDAFNVGEVFIAGDGNLLGLINSDGDYILAPKYNHLLVHWEAGGVQAIHNKKFIALKLDGQPIADPDLFDETVLFGNSYIRVEWDGKKYPMTMAGEPIGFKLSDVRD